MSCTRSRPTGERLDTATVAPQDAVDRTVGERAGVSSCRCDGTCALHAAGEQGGLLAPRAQVTPEELVQMPPSLTPAEALPWTRLSRGAFYKMLAAGDIASCRLGHSIRIPTRRFLLGIGVLDEESI
jgi:hypothetical protein